MNSWMGIKKSWICLNGILIHYIYMEDHMWELKVFNKDEVVFDFKVDWTDDLTFEKNIFDLDLLRELIIQQGNSAEDLELLFSLKDGNLNYDDWVDTLRGDLCR
jgi:hypothetical protein